MHCFSLLKWMFTLFQFCLLQSMIDIPFSVFLSDYTKCKLCFLFIFVVKLSTCFFICNSILFCHSFKIIVLSTKVDIQQYPLIFICIPINKDIIKLIPFDRFSLTFIVINTRNRKIRKFLDISFCLKTLLPFSCITFIVCKQWRSGNVLANILQFMHHSCLKKFRQCETESKLKVQSWHFYIFKHHKWRSHLTTFQVGLTQNNVWELATTSADYE